MKIIKILSLMLSIVLFVFTVGCDNVGGIDESSLDNTEDESSFESLENSTNLDSISDTSKSDLYEIDYICYYFFSVEDLVTYVSTGSTNPDDYHSFPYSISKSKLESYPSIEEINKGYLPVTELFGLNERALNGIIYTTFYTDYEINEFTYNFTIHGSKDGGFCLEITHPLDEQSIEKSNTVIYDDMSVKDVYEECIIQQNINGTSINYRTKHGKIVFVYFVYDNHTVCIYNFGSFVKTKEEVANAYDSFMTAPESAAFAPFFSEDQAVREEAFAKFEANYAEIVNRAE